MYMLRGSKPPQQQAHPRVGTGCHHVAAPAPAAGSRTAIGPGNRQQRIVTTTRIRQYARDQNPKNCNNREHWLAGWVCFVLGPASDDADLVGDLERVEVLGETNVRLLLAVRPATAAHKTHEHTGAKSRIVGSPMREGSTRKRVGITLKRTHANGCAVLWKRYMGALRFGTQRPTRLP